MTASDGGFRADPAGMAAAAARLDDVATAVDAARPTAAQVSGDAFGLVGGLFAGAATAAVHTGAAAVSALAASLRRTAGELRHAARDYELTDTGAALAFAAVGAPAVSGLAGGTPDPVDPPAGPGPIVPAVPAGEW